MTGPEFGIHQLDVEKLQNTLRITNETNQDEEFAISTVLKDMAERQTFLSGVISEIADTKLQPFQKIFTDAAAMNYMTIPHELKFAYLTIQELEAAFGPSRINSSNLFIEIDSISTDFLDTIKAQEPTDYSAWLQQSLDEQPDRPSHDAFLQGSALVVAPFLTRQARTLNK